MRIGLISDTHMPGSIHDLWPVVFDSFREVDCIFHGGDIYTPDILDDLATLAPIYVARGNGDHFLDDHRVKDAWQLDLDGVNIGLVHRFPTPGRKSDAAILAHTRRLFPDRLPDVLVYGHTHQEAIHHVEGMLCVNPGSPTLPRNMSLRLGTIGFLELSGTSVKASVHQLTANGLEEIGSGIKNT